MPIITCRHLLSTLIHFYAESCHLHRFHLNKVMEEKITAEVIIHNNNNQNNRSICKVLFPRNL
ncbi:hypothetical protein T06_9393 [Trichinella sp. T6]|nr:hypothetical protein T06_9393 [Trichinella sp. T6]